MGGVTELDMPGAAWARRSVSDCFLMDCLLPEDKSVFIERGSWNILQGVLLAPAVAYARQERRQFFTVLDNIFKL